MSERPWLLVGLSMRPLAEAAARFGHAICVIDACADRDTRDACGGRLIRLECGASWRIDAAPLQAALVEAQLRFAPEGFAGIIPGSGFEGRPELLDLLAASAPVIGCDANLVRAVRTPRRWFALLDEIGAPHPAVSYDDAPAAPGWLVKSAGGSGGWHIRAWRPETATTTDDYFQQYVPGRPASALFLADGLNAKVIGWQWQRLASTGDLPWRYGGVISAPDLGATLREQISRLCSAIVERLSLRGLASLDFIVDGGRFAVLELNPRPTASIALYPQHDFLAAHVAASTGAMAEIALGDCSEVVGEGVVYATEALSVATGFEWPDWCSDIPFGAPRIAAGQPICTVRANANTPPAVEARLLRRLHKLSIALEENRIHDYTPHQRQHPGPAARPVAAC